MREPNDRQWDFLKSAHDAQMWDGGFFGVSRVLAEIGADETEGVSLFKSLRAEGWIGDVRQADMAALSGEAREIVLKWKEGLAPLAFSDTRERHFLAFVWDAEEQTRGQIVPGFDFSYVALKVGFGHEARAEATEFFTKLCSNGYILKTGPSSGALTNKGREIGKQISDEAKAKQKPQAHELTKHWKGYKTETDHFLRWAWKQHRGDLNKPVDLRSYAIFAGRNRYEALAIADWLQKHELMNPSKESTWANLHAQTYWDVPLNTSFEHRYLLKFTTTGVTEAYRLTQEHRQRFSRWGKLIGDFFGSVKGVMAALVAIVGAVGYLTGYYNGMKGTATTQPAAQITTHPTAQTH
jgi:hypothetical protein